ncbi:thiamine-binding protein [Natrinema marinum]|uniref:thiamine-binding protein n=1 Tax=Natrinema marinum TaxID=2961598 RepID=UPI0020C8EA51|nr:thiamine-binding protein [Natrinema marinum]
MTVIARFEVIPIREGSMSQAIASALHALDQFPVSYETTATDTILEGETVGDVLAAVQAAHEAIDGDRVITSLELDETRGRRQSMYDRLESVERTLGRPPQKRHSPPQQRSQGVVRSREQSRTRRGQSPRRSR